MAVKCVEDPSREERCFYHRVSWYYKYRAKHNSAAPQHIHFAHRPYFLHHHHKNPGHANGANFFEVLRKAPPFPSHLVPSRSNQIFPKPSLSQEASRILPPCRRGHVCCPPDPSIKVTPSLVCKKCGVLWKKKNHARGKYRRC